MTPRATETSNQEGNVMRELVIAGEEACGLAAELVQLTGESLQVAVLTALRQELERERARKQRLDRIMAITRDIARGSRIAA
jgi:hypothetical protein